MRLRLQIYVFSFSLSAVCVARVGWVFARSTKRIYVSWTDAMWCSRTLRQFTAAASHLLSWVITKGYFKVFQLGSVCVSGVEWVKITHSLPDAVFYINKGKKTTALFVSNPYLVPFILHNFSVKLLWHMYVWLGSGFANDGRPSSAVVEHARFKTCHILTFLSFFKKRIETSLFMLISQFLMLL